MGCSVGSNVSGSTSQTEDISFNVGLRESYQYKSTSVHPNMINNQTAAYRAPESAVYYWVSHGVSALLYRREGRMYNRHFLLGVNTFQLSMDGQSRRSWAVPEP